MQTPSNGSFTVKFPSWKIRELVVTNKYMLMAGVIDGSWCRHCSNNRHPSVTPTQFRAACEELQCGPSSFVWEIWCCSWHNSKLLRLWITLPVMQVFSGRVLHGPVPDPYLRLIQYPIPDIQPEFVFSYTQSPPNPNFMIWPVLTTAWHISLSWFLKAASQQG